MKVKRILRFYFYTESLERALDNIILKKALYTGADGESAAQFILSVIDEKRRLSDLWIYLDGIMAGLAAADRLSLKSYAAARGCVKNVDEGARREWRRAVIKFRRRARRLESFSEGITAVGKYYCLIAV